MQKLLSAIVIASLSTLAAAQTAAPKPAAAEAKPAAKPGKAVSVKKEPAPTRRQAVEEATPVEEADPRIKLSEAELAIAKRVHVGEIPCELGAKVTVKPLRRDGFFLVVRGANRFVMHPVESRTGAIRLEDPVRGALWLQIGNKSMLMNQKEGKRLADECQSPEQAKFAAEMKPVNLLEAPKPAAPTAAAPSAAPAAPAAATAPAAGTAPASSAPQSKPNAPAAPAPGAPLPAY